MWIGDGQSLTLINEADGQLKSFRYVEGANDSPGSHVVTSLYRDAAGDMWLGFFTSGIDLVDKQASVFANDRHDPYDKNSITDGGVISSFEDASGNLWIGTGYGLSYLDRKTDKITRIQHEPGNRQTPSGSTMLSVIEDHKQTLWLGVWSGGLNRRDSDTGEYTYYMPEANNPNSLLGKELWDVIEDSRRDIWVVSELGGAAITALPMTLHASCLLPKCSTATAFCTVMCFLKTAITIFGSALWVVCFYLTEIRVNSLDIIISKVMAPVFLQILFSPFTKIATAISGSARRVGGVM